jgi:thymidylate kinase
MPNKSLFIVFEGTECAGKTTAIDMLEDWFKENHRETVRTRAPGGTPIGAKIREIIVGDQNKDLSDTANALLFAADYRHTLESVVLPAINAGKTVISDRSNLSCLNYQYRADSLSKLLEINNRLKTPDVVFVMTTDYETFTTRRDARDPALNNARDYIDQETHDGQVERYLHYADTHPVAIVIDCYQSKEQIFKDILKIVKDRL